MKKCNICGNIIEILHNGGGKIYCCGKEMQSAVKRNDGPGKEKHVPILKGNEIIVAN